MGARIPRTRYQAEELLRRARRTNAANDRRDQRHGDGTPGDGVTPAGLDPGSALSLLLRCAQEAIAAGIVLRNWDCVAEGLAMLEQATGYQPIAKG